MVFRRSEYLVAQFGRFWWGTELASSTNRRSFRKASQSFTLHIRSQKPHKMASQQAKPGRVAPSAPAARSSGSGARSILFIAAAAYLFISLAYRTSQVLGFTSLSVSNLPRPAFLQPKPAPVPSQAQVIDQRSFNALSHVPPSTEFNGTSKVGSSSFNLRRLLPSVMSC